MSNPREKKKLESDDPEQSARFIETMERIGLVENPEKAFEEAFGKIVKAKHRPKKLSNQQQN